MMTTKTRRMKNSSCHDTCAICGRQTILETHHIYGRKILRFNEKWNLVDICPTCHALVHADKIDIHGWQQTTDGLILVYDVESETIIEDTRSTNEPI